MYPVTPGFVAEVGDVDVAQPLSAEQLELIKSAFWKYAVLIFPDQSLDAEQHLAFARNFGCLEESIARHQPETKLRVRPELSDVSNLEHDGDILAADSPRRLHELGNRLWHTDSSFRRVPALASLLYARSIPPVGGWTEFADMRAGYDALPDDEKRRLHGKVAEHCIRYSRARIGFTEFSQEQREGLPPVPQAMVRTLRENGRRTLYLAAHAARVRGMPDDESSQWIDRLIDHATQPQFVYSHRWRKNDLVMWDNRCTMHRGTEFDDARYRRDMQRATVADVAPSCQLEGIDMPSGQ